VTVQGEVSFRGLSGITGASNIALFRDQYLSILPNMYLKTETLVLSNGFKIIYIAQKYSEVISMSLLGKAGSVLEKTPGTAHFLEHVLHDGSKNYPLKQNLVSLVRKSGGYTGAQTGKEFAEFSVKTVKSEIEKGFEYLSELILFPLLKKGSVEKEREIILQEHKRALSNNDRQLFESVLGTIYASKPMQRMVLGNEAGIKKIDLNTLTRFWSKHYTADNFLLCLSGDIKTDKIKELGEEYFGKIRKKGTVSLPKHPINKNASIKILRRENARQARVMLSYPVPLPSSGDHYVALLISYILGRGSLSRFFKTIREEKRLVYDISSWLVVGKKYSFLYTSAGVEEKRINELITSISKELNKLKDKPLKPQELNLVKNQIKAYKLFTFEDSLRLTSYYAKLRYLSTDASDYNSELKKINSVTSMDVSSAATRIFSQKPKLSVLARRVKKQEIDLEPLLMGTF